MQRDGLIVGDVAPAFPVAGEQFRVETPSDDGVDDCVVGAVEVVFFGDGEEVAPVVGSGALFLRLVSSSFGREEGRRVYRLSSAFWDGSKVNRPVSAIDTISCILMSSILSSVCELRKFLRQKAYSLTPGVLRARFHAQ